LHISFASGSARRSAVTPALRRVCRPQPWLEPAFKVLHTLQHPGNCARTRLAVAGESTPWDGPLGGASSEISSLKGYGSVTSTIALSLGCADSMRRTCVLDARNWSFGGGDECEWGGSRRRADAKWACLFHPLSPCDLNGALVAQAEDAAVLPPGIHGTAEAVWRARHARYLHKDYLGAPAEAECGRRPGGRRQVPAAGVAGCPTGEWRD
jgi:hypothetical protein